MISVATVDNEIRRRLHYSRGCHARIEFDCEHPRSNDVLDFAAFAVCDVYGCEDATAARMHLNQSGPCVVQRRYKVTCRAVVIAFIEILEAHFTVRRSGQ